jgi:DNA segregation ATPase FtsK/SpoIIIE-like protein
MSSLVKRFLGGTDDGYDPVYDEALEFVTSKGAASISLYRGGSG